jgi:plasmid stabilization system protein ParE
MAKYRLTSEARNELSAGVSFYDSEYPGLGQEFAIEIRRLCRLIAESPATGFAVRPDIRRRIVRRFPYSILYTLDGDEVVILAVAHQSRRPGYWDRRV